MSLSTRWHSILARNSPPAIEFLGTLLVQTLCFWIPSLIYVSLPYVCPLFSERNKLQKQEKQQTWLEIRECLIVVLRNQILSTTIHLVFLSFDAYVGKSPSYRFDGMLPGVFEVIRDVLVSILLREVLFYYIHRILHHPLIYPKIHKLHHRYTAPVALAAQYASPTEHMIANVVPIVLPPMMLRSHILTMWVFLGVELVETSTVHSGYGFFGGLAKMHDFHHEKITVCFGVLGLLDWLHGTDGKQMAIQKQKEE